MAIWKNGKILADSEAVVSVYDSGWMYGDSVFETTRSFNQAPFKLREHMERLVESAEKAKLRHPFTLDAMMSGYYELLGATPWARHEEHRGMIHLSRGLLPIYGKPEPWLMMTLTPLKDVSKGLYAKYTNGVHAITTTQMQIRSDIVDPNIKHRSRLHFRLAEAEVHEKDPATWPILRDEDGYMTESSGANLLVVKGRWIMSPSTADTLDGISRYFALFLMGLPFAYSDRLSELDAPFREMFFTATPFCVMPITRFNGEPVGDGKPGPVTLEVMEKWKTYVNCDFVEQARKWDEEDSAVPPDNTDEHRIVVPL